ncbi:MAG: 23S rRNA (pseudouridine(1915)-N(3))-methyltransferase RlmH [Bryobacteraceae bacterium]|nr:23S rRNA (pseudouridine(1915)-N(3))-methyltransferase RlmH [Bryobacteraceae bacterium]
MRIYLYYIGKARDAALNAYAAEFVKRASRWTACEMREIDPAKFDWSKHRTARKVFLDPAGQASDSAEMARLVEKMEYEGRDLVFLVGAHEGLTAAQRALADQLLSLSRMTFSHELARAVLAEQIYRALATLRNHPYIR